MLQNGRAKKACFEFAFEASFLFAFLTAYNKKEEEESKNEHCKKKWLCFVDTDPFL